MESLKLKLYTELIYRFASEEENYILYPTFSGAYNNNVGFIMTRSIL